MSEEIAEKDRIVSERIPSILSDTSFDFSVRGLQKIHFLLFKDLSGRAGEFRNKFNPRKKETILWGDSVKYALDSDIIPLLEEILKKEQEFDYTNLSEDEKLTHIARFFSDLWRIHPFYDGNTRTTTLFVIKRINQLGFPITNEPFELNAQYYRNALVRSAYESKRIPRDFSFLQQFLINAIKGLPINNLSSESLKIEQRTLKLSTNHGKR